MLSNPEACAGKHREQHQLMDQMNIDLTYSVCFNLAAQYEANEMYPEVLSLLSRQQRSLATSSGLPCERTGGRERGS